MLEVMEEKRSGVKGKSMLFNSAYSTQKPQINSFAAFHLGYIHYKVIVSGFCKPGHKKNLLGLFIYNGTVYLKGKMY